MDDIDPKIECVCGKMILSSRMVQHVKRMGCAMLERQDQLVPSERESARREAQEERQSTQKSKKAKKLEFQDEIRKDISLFLAKLRYFKMVDGALVDDFKASIGKFLKSTAHALGQDARAHIADEEELRAMESSIDSKLDWFADLQTEKQELAFLKRSVPILKPVPRVMGAPQESVDAEGMGPLTPRKTRKRISFDFLIPKEIQRLMNYNSKVRDDVYETLISWRKKRVVNFNDEKRIIADFEDGKVFLDHPETGLLCRVSEEEARAAAPDRPITILLIVYGDAFTPVNSLSGMAHAHSTLVRVTRHVSRHVTRPPPSHPPTPTRAISHAFCTL